MTENKAELEAAGELVRIPVSRVSRFEKQPRKYFDQRTLEDLAVSIMQKGQQVPVKVMPNVASPGDYTLIDGERRWRAHHLIWKETGKEPTILAMVEPVADFAKHMEASFISNLHRDDMTPLEKAEAYMFLRDRGVSEDGKRYTIEKIAKLAGKSQVHVISYIKLNKLPDEVKEMMHPDRPRKSRLTVTSAIEIAASTNDPDLMLQIAKSVVENERSVAETRFFIASQYDGVRIVNNHERDYAAEREATRMRVNGKYVDPAKEYKKIKGLLTRTKRDFDLIRQSVDLSVLMDHMDDPVGQTKALSDGLMQTMQVMFAIKDKLDALQKG